MTNSIPFLRTTIGKKMLVGLSGLGFAFFLLTHMAGNLLLLVGPEAYNEYSYKLTSTKLIYLAEAGLVLMFALHVFLTIQLTAANRAARKTPYERGAGGPKRTSFVAKTLILSGLVLLVFTILHLITFKYGTVYTVTYGTTEMRDLYTLVVEKFREPGYVAWYVFAMLILGAHLSHGVSASLQSLGLTTVRNCTAKKIGWAFAALVTIGFIIQPLYLFFSGGAS
ncbi:MAG: succinate dehydrogenase cytochrome b subunit [Deltaproteobacteria bacterium]|nr:succinate dehydrogenase cytochrome b subunit [Deltaproteobacteria bacterium]